MADKRAKANPNQTIPGGHFTSDGLSTGKRTGAVRSSFDAYQGKRESSQRDSGTKPRN